MAKRRCANALAIELAVRTRNRLANGNLTRIGELPDLVDLRFPVPRHFFDIHDGHSLMRDDEGQECSGAAAIRREAMETLPQVARDEIPKDGDQQAYTVLVRNESNVTVYTATLTFAGLWVGDLTEPDRVEG